MIIYAESNLIIEWAAAQEEHEACERLIRLAEERLVSLVVPAFSLSEPIQTLHRRHTERKQLQQRVDDEIHGLARRASYQERLRHGAELMAILEESRLDEEARLREVLDRITGAAELIPLDGAVLRRAQDLQDEHGLKLPDAVVLASVTLHLEQAAEGPKLFVQRDRKDFMTPDIEDLLSEHECEIIGSFVGAAGRVTAMQGDTGSAS